MTRLRRFFALGGLSAALAVLFAAPSFADEPGVSARIVPSKPSSPSLATPSPNGLPAFHCDGDYCGFDWLRDLWKRDESVRLPMDAWEAMQAHSTEFQRLTAIYSPTPPLVPLDAEPMDRALTSPGFGNPDWMSKLDAGLVQIAHSPVCGPSGCGSR